MEKLYRVAALILIVGISSCNHTKNNNDPSQREEKKMQTAALINAQLGMIYLEKQDIPRAKQKLLLALEEAPTLPEAWYSMGYFLETTGNKTEAGKHYLTAVKLAPKRGDVLNNYGTFLCRHGDYKGAITHFMLAVKDPNYLEPGAAYENAGLCALKMPNKLLAAEYFRAAIAQDSNRAIASEELLKINQSSSTFNDDASSRNENGNIKLSAASN